jgi:hypothetical protein
MSASEQTSTVAAMTTVTRWAVFSLRGMKKASVATDRKTRISMNAEMNVWHVRLRQGEALAARVAALAI